MRPWPRRPERRADTAQGTLSQHHPSKEPWQPPDAQVTRQVGQVGGTRGAHRSHCAQEVTSPCWASGPLPRLMPQGGAGSRGRASGQGASLKPYGQQSGGLSQGRTEPLPAPNSAPTPPHHSGRLGGHGKAAAALATTALCRRNPNIKLSAITMATGLPFDSFFVANALTHWEQRTENGRLGQAGVGRKLVPPSLTTHPSSHRSPGRCILTQTLCWSPPPRPLHSSGLPLPSAHTAAPTQTPHAYPPLPTRPVLTLHPP